jgi:HEAT repeat protein
MFLALRCVWTCLLVCAVVVAAIPASAADKIDKLSSQLKSADDFRVRTQAALALGASKSKRALKPLCAGLEDSSATVRAASAAAS